jgi:hypothetical protein
MRDDAGFRVLFEAALEIDQERLSEAQRGGHIVADRDLPLLQHQNRVALAVAEVTPRGHPDGSTDLSCYEVPLRCVLHPAVGCRFREAKLVVDLRATHDALVRDMAPRDVRGDHPVEVTTTVSAGLTFEILPAVAGVELKRERSASRKVYQPEILASGRGFAQAVWTFRSVPGEYLHSEREVRLLVSAPADGKELRARFNLRAQVALDGAGAIVPLLRKRAELGETYDLLSL